MVIIRRGDMREVYCLGLEVARSSMKRVYPWIYLDLCAPILEIMLE